MGKEKRTDRQTDRDSDGLGGYVPLNSFMNTPHSSISDKRWILIKRMNKDLYEKTSISEHTPHTRMRAHTHTHTLMHAHTHTHTT